MKLRNPQVLISKIERIDLYNRLAALHSSSLPRSSKILPLERPLPRNDFRIVDAVLVSVVAAIGLLVAIFLLGVSADSSEASACGRSHRSPG